MILKVVFTGSQKDVTLAKKLTKEAHVRLQYAVVSETDPSEVAGSVSTCTAELVMNDLNG